MNLWKSVVKCPKPVAMNSGDGLCRQGLAAATILLLVLFSPAPLAGGLVGDGTPESCGEAGFESVIQGGGLVEFACGPDPYTLVLTSRKLLSGPSNNPLVIDGSGAFVGGVQNGPVTIDGQNATGLFATSGAVTLQNITLTGGRDRGAAIHIGGGLTKVLGSTVRNNRAINAGGQTANGVIWADFGDLFISASLFHNNHSEFTGGVVFNQGEVVEIEGSVFRNNTSANGGGVYEGSGNLFIRTSTFHDNNSGGAGAIGTSGNMEIYNSTFSGNNSNAGTGGAIRHHSVSNGFSFTSMKMVNTTVVNNTTRDGGNAGIQLTHFTCCGGAPTPLPILRNNIIANNSNGADCSSDRSINTDAPNVDSDGSCKARANNAANVTTATSAEINLDELADNGGLTPTHALLSGSVAINAGDNTVCASPGVDNIDQRGVERPKEGVCDIGAFEFEGSTPPEITVNPVSHDFGMVTVGTSDLTDIVVQNDGGSNLNIDAVANVDSLAAPFSITSDGCSSQSIAPGDSCSIQVQFSPGSTGSFSDSFDIPSDDADENPVTVSLQGEGTPAPAPDITVAPDPVSFPDTVVDETSQMDVTVTNDGNADLLIGGLQDTEVLDPPFSLSADNCSGQTLQPAENCTATVTFAPGTTGEFTDSFNVPSNDPDEMSVSVDVDGTGVPAPVPDITVNPTEVMFTDTVEGSTDTRNVTISHTGDAGTDLILGTLADTDTLDAPFSISNDNCSGQTLAQGESCMAELIFSPGSAGDFTDSFNVPSNDPDEGNVAVMTEGTGLATPQPDIGFELDGNPFNPDDGLNFGNAIIGDSESKTITIRNDGNAGLNFSSIGVTGTDAGDFDQDNDCGAFLEAAGTCNVMVEFMPGSVGSKQATLNVDSDDPDEAMVDIALNGAGDPVPTPNIAVDPDALDFGDVAENGGAAGPMTVNISNNGTENLIIDAISISGTDGADFLLDGSGCGTLPASLAPETGCSVEVDFDPAGLGEKGASLGIQSDDPDTPTLSVPLAGTSSTDGDGIPDSEEAGVPNADGSDGTGDGNGDGTPDSEQDNVSSFMDENGDYVTLASDGGDLASVEVIAAPDDPSRPDDVDFSRGLFGYNINCPGGVCATPVQVTVTLHAGDTPDTWYKFGPEPTDMTDHYYEFLFDASGNTGAEINGDTITLNFVDGGRGDADGMVNGVIVDPGGPGVVSESSDDGSDGDSGDSGGGGSSGGGTSSGGGSGDDDDDDFLGVDVPGCSLSDGRTPFDPLLLIMLAVSMGWLNSRAFALSGKKEK